MKIRPYRVCDICGEEYHKTHNCMKVKILIDPMRYTEMYGDLPIMSKWDICPKCAEDLMSELMLKVADRKTENCSEIPNNSTRSKMEQVETMSCQECKHWDMGYHCDVGWDCKYEPKDEPQTDGYMTAEQTEDYRKMLDKAEHKVYGNIEDEPQTEDTCKGCVNETDCPWK